MTRPTRWLPALIFALAALAPPAGADQTDPALDPLLDELSRTTRPDRARALQSRIWSLWFRHEDAAVQKRFDEGEAALNRGEYQHAIDAFTAAIKRAPRFAEAWNRRATTWYAMGEYRRSLNDIQHVLTLEPRHFGALAGQGLCLLELGLPEVAMESFKEALRINPHMEGIRRQLEDLENAEGRQAGIGGHTTG